MEGVEEGKKVVGVGKVCGGVGSYWNIEGGIEEMSCKKVGIEGVKVGTEVMEGDGDGEYMSRVGIVGRRFEKMGRELGNVERRDIGEVEEYLEGGEKGCCGMGHKGNGMSGEGMSGMGGVVGGKGIGGMEDMSVWDEGDIWDCWVEGVILGERSMKVDQWWGKLRNVVDKVVVYGEGMMENVKKSGGVMLREGMMVGVVRKGVVGEDGQKWVERNGMGRWVKGEDLGRNVEKEGDMRKYVSKEEMEKWLDYEWLLGNVEMIMGGLGIE